MNTKIRRAIREPLVQFLVIGACIYGAYALFGTPDDGMLDDRVVVDETRIRTFASQWQQRWNRAPTREELDGVINAFVKETILYRAAIEMGLDKDDPITRRRMAQKLEFLTNDIALVKEPADGELEAYFASNAADYRAPDRITFSQVFFDPDTRGAGTLDDAAAVLEYLATEAAPDPDGLNEFGDRSMTQRHFANATELDVRRALGTEFAADVMALEPGRWHGPVLSGFGTHLVYVYALDPAPDPEFAQVREAVLADWQRAQQTAFNDRFFDSLKERYTIEVEEVPEGLVLDTSSVVTAEKEAGPAS